VTFDFSFTNGTATVTGEIDGLTAGGTGEAATHVFIDSAPFPIGFTLPHDTINDTVLHNSFDVNASGQITSFAYNAFAGGGFTYNLCLGDSCNFGGDASLKVFLTSLVNDAHVATSTINFTSPSAVPLPTALPLFATGLVGLGLLGWRRKKKAIAA
jgi:hypothetical protein